MWRRQHKPLQCELLYWQKHLRQTIDALKFKAATSGERQTSAIVYYITLNRIWRILSLLCSITTTIILAPLYWLNVVLVDTSSIQYTYAASLAICTQLAGDRGPLQVCIWVYIIYSIPWACTNIADSHPPTLDVGTQTCTEFQERVCPRIFFAAIVGM